jgi:hypothetical protein
VGAHDASERHITKGIARCLPCGMPRSRTAAHTAARWRAPGAGRAGQSRVDGYNVPPELLDPDHPIWQTTASAAIFADRQALSHLEPAPTASGRAPMRTTAATVPRRRGLGPTASRLVPGTTGTRWQQP